MFSSIVISSGHGLHVRGAHGIIDEVDEARSLVERLAIELRTCGVDVVTFHDNVSTNQTDNLHCITDFHNSYARDLDISVHFNAYEQVSHPMGVEVLFVTEGDLAGKVSKVIADSGGLTNRGAKKRTDLHFLNCTSAPAIMLEVCFVDSECDCNQYRDRFNEICYAIADCLSGLDGAETETADPEAFYATGKVSYFGGPDDAGVSADEGLAFIHEIDVDNQFLFLPFQPEGTTGLARRLNPMVSYIAMRWDYDVHPKEDMLYKRAKVRAIKTGVELIAVPADWGPHGSTDRIADISPSLMYNLGIDTDDEVEIIFPYHEDD